MATKKDFRKAIEKVKAFRVFAREQGMFGKEIDRDTYVWVDAYVSLFMSEKGFDEHWFREECSR